MDYLIPTILFIAGLAVFGLVGYVIQSWQYKLKGRRWIIKYPFGVTKGQIITISSNVTNDPKIIAGQHKVKVIRVFKDEKKIEVESAD